MNRRFINIADTPLEGIAVDDTYVYWTGARTRIGRAKLNGTHRNPRFITGTGVHPHGGRFLRGSRQRQTRLLDELQEGRIGGAGKKGRIGRAKLDGSGKDREVHPHETDVPWGWRSGRVAADPRRDAHGRRRTSNGRNDEQASFAGRGSPRRCHGPGPRTPRRGVPGRSDARLLDEPPRRRDRARQDRRHGRGPAVHPHEGWRPQGDRGRPAHVLAPFVYWGQGNSMGRAKINGTGVRQSFMQGFVAGCWGVAVDARYRSPRNRAHVYWSYYYWYYYGGGLGRANINGTGANYNFIPFPRASRSLSPSTARTSTGPFAARARSGAPGLTGPIGNGGSSAPGDTRKGSRSTPNTFTGPPTRARSGAPRPTAPAWTGGSFARGGTPIGVAVGAGHVYWAGGHAIGRAKVDGTNREPRCIRTRGHPIGVAVGPGRN